ncbi:unnamed protein product [Lactuca virosa]|uniref:Uncharacterized protein n=1 Tax=Lactuca virosa TaxID=75947 RepID=A0AAU9NGF0_9ASTR|nr:unnamed protein product [Lactuca virosa]
MLDGSLSYVTVTSCWLGQSLTKWPIPWHFKNRLNRVEAVTNGADPHEVSTLIGPILLQVPSEKLVGDQNVINLVIDESDSILELSGLEGVPYEIDRPPAPALRGQSAMLRECLFWRRNTPYSKVVVGPTMRSETPAEGEAVLEYESTTDSYTHPASGDPVVISSSPYDKKMKDDRSKGKPPYFTLSKPAGKMSTSSKYLVSPKRLRSIHHTKPAKLPDSNKATEHASLDNPTISKPPPTPNTNPSLLQDRLIQNDLDLVTATATLSSFSPSLKPPISLSSALITDVVVTNPVPIPKTSYTKQAPCSFLMSLASSLSSFLHPFTTTSFVNKPSLGKMNDEEGIDKAHTHILEGLHWMNEVPLCSKARAAATYQIHGVGQVVRMSLDLVESMHIQDELHLLNQDLQLKLDEMSAYDASSAKAL